jgi:hypothetical protein
MKPIFRSVVLLSAITLGSAPAAAQPSVPAAHAPSLSESLRGPAKDAYDSASLLVMNGDFSGALTKFRLAYELSKDPRLLYQMAICEKNLRHYARTQVLLVQYLRDSGASPENKAAVEAALAAIQNLVGTLNLTVHEEGATVLVDGDVVGTTPLSAPLVVDLGKHTVLARKPGYDTAEQTVEVPGGSPVTALLVLVGHARLARLVLASDDDAIVSVDGKVVAKARFDGQLAPGMHEVLITEPGRSPYATQIELRDGETRTVQVTLESEKHGGAIWPWVVGGVAVAAGAAVGGYFLFKPADNGPARVTGDFGNVHLTSVTFR